MENENDVADAIDEVEEILKMIDEITTTANVGAYPKAFVKTVCKDCDKEPCICPST